MDSVYVSIQDSTEGEIIFSKTKYLTDGFSITLQKPNSASLTSIKAMKSKYQAIEISDLNANIAVLSGNFVAIKNGEQVGLFKYVRSTDNSYITYLYSDRELTIEGTITEASHTATYNLYLEKGWNILIFYVNSSDNTYKYESVNTVPSDFQWIGEVNYSLAGSVWQSTVENESATLTFSDENTFILSDKYGTDTGYYTYLQPDIRLIFGNYSYTIEGEVIDENTINLTYSANNVYTFKRE